MLTSTKPRSPPHTTRLTHTPATQPISPSLPPNRPSSQSTIIAPVPEPSQKPHHRSHKSSISNTMHWLSRSSTQTSTSTPYAPSKPTRISEAKLVRSIEILSQRSGVLGTGATIVRTPDDALRATGVRLTFDGKAQDEDVSVQPQQKREPLFAPPTGSKSVESSTPEVEPISPPYSPPLPALRCLKKTRTTFSALGRRPPRVPRAPPLHHHRCSPTPRKISPSPTPPAFAPVLMSEVPTGAIDPSKIIVTLETCTVTYQPRSIQSVAYICSLLPRSRSNSVASSVYSTASADMSTYRHHLASQGLLPQSTFSIHIFLDRPSAPYAHILNYLRSPLPSLELCVEELRLRQGPRLHTRGHSSSTSGSVHSLHASVYSLHTLLERVESDVRPGTADNIKCIAPAHAQQETARSPPTPESWNGPTLRRTSSRQSVSKSPPAGWI
ncbi:hypothetical protein BD779DRAFT_1491658 [Infundibulicybe gibba]|nr:hypothetical protein BD779DRAFT_1491658 [Infundibulicybe gibba]